MPLSLDMPHQVLSLSLFPNHGDATVVGYRFYTAKDAPKRDPTAWVLEWRDDASSEWELVHQERART